MPGTSLHTTHANTHAHTHTHTHTLTLTFIHTHMHTHTQTCTHTCTHTYTHAHIHTNIHTHSHAHTHAHSHSHYSHWQTTDFVAKKKTRGKNKKSKGGERAYYELLADLTEDKEVLGGPRTQNLCPRNDDWASRNAGVSSELMTSLRQLGQTLFGGFRARVKDFATKQLTNPNLAADSDTRAVMTRLSSGADVPAMLVAIQVTLLHEHTHVHTRAHAHVHTLSHSLTVCHTLCQVHIVPDDEREKMKGIKPHRDTIASALHVGQSVSGERILRITAPGVKETKNLEPGSAYWYGRFCAWRRVDNDFR